MSKNKIINLSELEYKLTGRLSSNNQAPQIGVTYLPPMNLMLQNKAPVKPKKLSLGVPLPKSFSWNNPSDINYRNKNYKDNNGNSVILPTDITMKPGNQYGCGSCWAWAVSMSLSDRVAIAGYTDSTGKLTHKNPNIGPSYLISFSVSENNPTQCKGCNGGMIDEALAILSDKDKTNTNSQYNYNSFIGGVNNQCWDYSWCTSNCFCNVSQSCEDLDPSNCETKPGCGIDPITATCVLDCSKLSTDKCNNIGGCYVNNGKCSSCSSNSPADLNSAVWGFNPDKCKNNSDNIFDPSKNYGLYKVKPGSIGTFYTNNKINYNEAINQIKQSIYENGPIPTGFVVFNDFMLGNAKKWSNTNGIYIHLDKSSNTGCDKTNCLYPYMYNAQNDQEGGHAVVIVGWGEEIIPVKGTLLESFGDSSGNLLIPYWVVRNSWSENWNEKGYFRVAMTDSTKGINDDLQIDIKGENSIGGVVDFHVESIISKPDNDTVVENYTPIYVENKFCPSKFLKIVLVFILSLVLFVLFCKYFKKI